MADSSENLVIVARLKDELSRGLAQLSENVDGVGKKSKASFGEAEKGASFFDKALGSVIKKSPYLIGADLIARVAGFHNVMDALNQTLDAVSGQLVKVGQAVARAFDPAFFKAREEAKKLTDNLKALAEELGKLQALQRLNIRTLNLGSTEAEFDLGGLTDRNRLTAIGLLESAQRRILETQRRINETPMIVGEADVEMARNRREIEILKEQTEIVQELRKRIDELGSSNAALVGQDSRTRSFFDSFKEAVPFAGRLNAAILLAKGTWEKFRETFGVGPDANIAAAGGAGAANDEGQRLQIAIEQRRRAMATAFQEEQIAARAREFFLRDEAERVARLAGHYGNLLLIVAKFAGTVIPEVEKRNADFERNQFEAERARLTAARDSNFFRGAMDAAREAVELFDTLYERGQFVGRALIDTFGSGLSNLFNDIITGSKSAADAFKAFAISVLQDIARMISQMLAMQIIQQALGFVGLGGGLAGGGGGSVPVGNSNYGGVGIGVGGGGSFPINSMAGGPLGGGGRPVTINFHVTSLDPRGAKDVILQQMPHIRQALSSSLGDGEDRDFLVAVRGA